MSDPKPNGLEKPGHGPNQCRTVFVAPEGSEMSRLYAKLEAQATLLSLTQSKLEQALADKQAAEDMLQTLVGRDEQSLGYIIQELRGKLRAAEASAAAMREALRKCQEACQDNLAMYQHKNEPLLLEAFDAASAALADTAGQHLLDELEGLRELVAGPDEFLIELAAQAARIAELEAAQAFEWIRPSGIGKSGWYWWWSEDDDGRPDGLPVPVHVLKSGHSPECSFFASGGQLGWTRAQSVTDMGGWWSYLNEEYVSPPKGGEA